MTIEKGTALDARNTQPVGFHVSTDLSGCAPDKVKDVAWLKDTILRGVQRYLLNIVAQSEYRFPVTGGNTLVFILAESHLVLHTWPEFNYIALDLFVCGKTAGASGFIEWFSQQVEARYVDTRSVLRSCVAESKEVEA